MCVTVFVPITLPGSLISTRGNRAARANNASDEIPNPGAITPPRYSPFAEITSNVIAVPKSTTMQGPPYSWNAATPLTMRSAPTSRGLSTSTAIPVFTPGSTNNARRPKYFLAISPSVQFTGGTTELMITPPIASRSSPASKKRLRVRTPYSSTVCSRAVVRRQLAINCSSRNTPSTVLVFPTSIVSSMKYSLRAVSLKVQPDVKELAIDTLSRRDLLPHLRNIARDHGNGLPIFARDAQQAFRR